MGCIINIFRYGDFTTSTHFIGPIRFRQMRAKYESCDGIVYIL